jgi:ribosome biogenesis GTPase / thiamine phosphate phosphatase
MAKPPASALSAFGWDSYFADQVATFPGSDLAPARVAEEHGRLLRLWSDLGETLAPLSGKLLAEEEDGAMPAVGDWVLARLDPGAPVVRHVLRRRTKLSRTAAGERQREQVLAANVDVAFVVQSLNRDFNPRRLERYLAVIRQGGVEPVILLSKADLCHDVTPFLEEAARVAPNTPTALTSVVTGMGLDEVRLWLEPGRTVVLLGSSGVGKSTLVNLLLGAALQRTAEVREDDDRGRHTTSSRRMIRLPGGALLIDTPGLREMGLWEAERGIEEAFADLAELAAGCRFRDCTHQHEPGCAVREAAERGELDPARLGSYAKLSRELMHQARKASKALQSEENRRWKRIHKEFRRQARAKDTA